LLSTRYGVFVLQANDAFESLADDVE